MMSFGKMIWVCMLMLIGGVAFAQADVSVGSWFSDAMAQWGALKGAGGFEVAAVVALAIRVLMSSMKVSFLREMLWDKLPDGAKLLVAPVLGLALAALAVSPFSLKAAVIGLITGAGAAYLHDLLAAIESLPSISPSVKALISLGEKILGGK